MAVLRKGSKCSHTTCMLRFFTVSRLALNTNLNFEIGSSGEERPLGHFFSYYLPTGNSKVFNCLSKPDVKGVANKSVTDRYLLDSRKILEAVKIL